MNRVETAGKLFMDRNSCSQAVAGAFAPAVGLDVADAMRLASGFGGGMRIGGACGAATGAILILGLACNRGDSTDDRKSVMEAVETFYARFKERVGAIDCPDILGCDFRTDEGRALMNERSLRESVCLPTVRAAAEILEEMLDRDRS